MNDDFRASRFAVNGGNAVRAVAVKRSTLSIRHLVPHMQTNLTYPLLIQR